MDETVPASVVGKYDIPVLSYPPENIGFEHGDYSSWTVASGVGTLGSVSYGITTDSLFGNYSSNATINWGGEYDDSWLRFSRPVDFPAGGTINYRFKVNSFTGGDMGGATSLIVEALVYKTGTTATSHTDHYHPDDFPEDVQLRTLTVPAIGENYSLRINVYIGDY